MSTVNRYRVAVEVNQSHGKTIEFEEYAITVEIGKKARLGFFDISSLAAKKGIKAYQDDPTVLSHEPLDIIDVRVMHLSTGRITKLLIEVRSATR